ncbi:hypothetical protein RRG08_049062 [Elysia crispata]|uniref:Uncharacterized protein n=1 Tax=Elysia crispata TaxID=231223 RepID=A0AAE1AC44_9GAST|nr:hypothetical protein RRG08_049062 [Elysia crispata]
MSSRFRTVVHTLRGAAAYSLPRRPCLTSAYRTLQKSGVSSCVLARLAPQGGSADKIAENNCLHGVHKPFLFAKSENCACYNVIGTRNFPGWLRFSVA